MCVVNCTSCSSLLCQHLGGPQVHQCNEHSYPTTQSTTWLTTKGTLHNRLRFQYVIIYKNCHSLSVVLTVPTETLPNHIPLSHPPLSLLGQDGVGNWRHRRWRSQVKIRTIYWKHQLDKKTKSYSNNISFKSIQKEGHSHSKMTDSDPDRPWPHRSDIHRWWTASRLPYMFFLLEAPPFFPRAREPLPHDPSNDVRWYRMIPGSCSCTLRCGPLPATIKNQPCPGQTTQTSYISVLL